MNTSLSLATPSGADEAPCTTTALLAEGLQWLYDTVQPSTAIVPCVCLATKATSFSGSCDARTRIRAYVFDVASEQDLLRLKRIAKAGRSAPGDAEDIAFLEARRKGSMRM